MTKNIPAHASGRSASALIRSNAGASSLAELLVATGIGLAVMGTVMGFSTAQVRTMRDQTTQIDLQTTTRSIIDLFAREVRRAGADPLCAKTVTAVMSGSASDFRMQTDLNANGTVDSSTEDITYRIVNNSTQLERVTGGSTEILLSGYDLSGSRFRYFDASGTEIVPSPSLTASQRAAVRRVRIELAATGTGVGTGSGSLRARAATDVELRNRFFNLSVTCS